MISWTKIFSLILIAGSKFLLAPFVAELPPYDLGFWNAFTITTIGGMLGIIVFVFFGDFVVSRWSALVYLLKRIYTSKEKLAEQKNKPRKKFKWRTRFIVRTKRRFGLIGIAFFTPCILSIPIGCVVAVSIYRSKLKVLPYIIVSLFFWSFVLNILAQYFGISKYFVN